jgi:hypothetical protein
MVTDLDKDKDMDMDRVKGNDKNMYKILNKDTNKYMETEMDL